MSNKKVKKVINERMGLRQRFGYKTVLYFNLLWGVSLKYILFPTYSSHANS